MNTKKRAEPDVPRRIWAETMERINAHLDKTAKKIIGKQKKAVISKTTFNEFLVDCLNAYEMVKDSEVFYATDLFTDLAEARGAAIVKAVRAKEAPKAPKKVVIVGEDKLA